MSDCTTCNGKGWYYGYVAGTADVVVNCELCQLRAENERLREILSDEGCSAHFHDDGRVSDGVDAHVGDITYSEATCRWIFTARAGYIPRAVLAQILKELHHRQSKAQGASDGDTSLGLTHLEWDNLKDVTEGASDE